MTRSTAIALGSLGICLFVVLALTRGGRSDRDARGDEPPFDGSALAGRAAGFDVILITLDTTRADRIGCYGHAAAATPRIDRLAGDGVRFTDAIAPAPLTLPSHATILTGLYPPAHGARNNGTFELADDRTSLAEILADAGYATGAAVGAFVLDRRYGLAQGFDSYDDAVEVDDGDSHSSQRSAEAVTTTAIDWLGRHLGGGARKPVFYWAHYFDPHAPYAPPASHRHHASPYDGEIAYADEQIGRLLDFVATNGDLGRTLVIFTADHGEGLGDHDEDTHSILVYESTIRVPLILSNPTLFPERAVASDRIASLADVVPTTLALLGIESALPFDGVSLLAPAPDRAVYSEAMAPLLNHGWASLHAMRRLGDKLIEGPDPEYYALADDRLEERNTVQQASAAVTELRIRLRAYLAPYGGIEEVVRQESPLDPETAERLAAMGYGRSLATRSTTEGRPDPKRMIALWRRIDRARELSAAGQYEPALEEIRWVLRGDPDNGKAWYIATQIHNRLKQLDEAETCVRNALRLSPRADGWLSLATLLLARKRWAEAEEALRSAEELDPHDGRLFIARGDGLALRGRFEEALVQFERALTVDPVHAGARAREKIALVKRQLGR